MQASTLAHRLAEHMLTTNCRLPVRDERPWHAALDRRSITRLANLIDAHLSETLSIDRPAAAAALSPFHFA